MTQIVILGSEQDEAKVFATLDKTVNVLTLVKVGNDNFPARPEDLNSVAKHLIAAIQVNPDLTDEQMQETCGLMVTGHTVDIVTYHMS